MDIYVKEFGPREAPAIIFLHGGGQSGWIWNAQLKYFQDYHCLIPDLPECGQSIAVKPFSIQNSVRLIADLIRDKAHEGKSYIVGTSLGAQITVQLLSETPELIKGAVINSAIVHPVQSARRMIRLIQLLAPVVSCKPFLKSVAKKFKIVDAADWESYYRDAGRFRGDFLERIMIAALNYQLPDGLERLKVPVLILIGEKEKGMMIRSARDLSAIIPNTQGYRVAGVGHGFCLEAPELFGRITRDWLSGEPLEMKELNPL